MPQTNIFEMLREPYRLPKRPKLFEAFAGVGCQHMAFNRLGIDVEMVGISEIDQSAIRSYMAIHGETKNWGSICDVHGKDLPQIDVLTYSFPCTDLSKAGVQKGLSKDTRSGLVYEVLRILHELDDEHRLPKVLIMENVVDLVQVKFIKQFQEIQFELEQLGYSNYTEVMNAKDFGVAQNRDRVFMVSILGDYYYEFPKPFPLVKRLKDYLETSVDEKYYISKKMYDGMSKTSFNSYKLENKIQDGDGYVSTLLARYEGSPQLVDENQCFGELNAKEELCEKMLATGELKEGDMIRHSYTKHRMAFENARTENSDNVSSCLTTRPDTLGVVVSSMIDDDGNVRRYLDSPIVDQFNVGDCADISFPNGYNKGKRVYDGYAPALNLTTTKDNFVVKQHDLRIRKLTPRECWRLMGIQDDEYDRASQVTKPSQLYKQAGNGIVVDVFAAILKNMTEEPK